MSASPWMPLYIADYLADTAHLSAGEHGAYLLLIMHYWRVGKLPTDERQLSRIARMNAREWTSARETIAAFFDDEWRPISGFFGHPHRVAPPGWQETRLRIFARDGFACVYCGTTTGRLECDHVFPASKGGGNDDDNLATACRSCNASKGAKLLMEWAQ